MAYLTADIDYFQQTIKLKLGRANREYEFELSSAFRQHSVQSSASTLTQYCSGSLSSFSESVTNLLNFCCLKKSTLERSQIAKSETPLKTQSKLVMT